MPRKKTSEPKAADATVAAENQKTPPTPAAKEEAAPAKVSTEAAKKADEVSAKTPPVTVGDDQDAIKAAEKARLDYWTGEMGKRGTTPEADPVAPQNFENLGHEEAHLERWKAGMRRQRAQEAREA